MVQLEQKVRKIREPLNSFSGPTYYDDLVIECPTYFQDISHFGAKCAHSLKN